MARFSRWSLIGVSLSALALAACGGSDSSERVDASSAQQPRGAERPTEERVAAPSEGAVVKPVTDAQDNLATPIAQGMPKPNRFWWPETVDLSPLRQHEADSNPLGPDFDYAEEFSKLNLTQVKADIEEVMTTSQDWWPADYGHYGPFFIRMAWHSAGTYRLADGRGGAAGGQLRFEPLNSWPDNTNLDKARRLLWPIKAKYGHALSWSDLMVLTGNVAMESMGFETIGFAGGREDAWQPELVYWGAEEDFLANDRRYDEDGKLQRPLGASVMGLIYVNPEGPNRSHDPIAAAADIRETFGRMAMNDEETVALIAGGHTFGKAHGAHKPEECLSREPAATGIEGQGVGWNNKCGKGNAEDTVTSGLEGAWTADPARWTHQYLTFLYQFEWEKTESPAGAIQWKPVEEEAQNLVPDAHREDIRHAPMMLTTDIALKEDPAYREITTRFLNDPEEFELAFAKAWFKLTHRDMGPREGYLGDMAPEETFVWQDPVEAPVYQLVNRRDIANLKADILDTELTVPELVRTAWASAASYRGTDNRGGTNGARIRFAPQNGWEVNNPAELDKVLAVLEGIQEEFNDQAPGGRQISMADLIVLAGAAAIERAAADAGHDISVPFTPGRGDATEEMTDAASFDWLEPTYDAFRNYGGVEGRLTRVQRMVDRADLLTLTVPEMTVLMGGMRSLGANAGGTEEGILVENPGTLTNDFFQNLLDMRTEWKPAEGQEGIFVGSNRMTGEEKWRATDVDLVFGSNSELRAVVERYAYDGAEDEFVDDFVEAWTKVMNLGRVDQS